MDMRNEIALVTGANRGIGNGFVEELRARGVKKIYAAVRQPESVPSRRGSSR
ncbi:hypothetical protein [Nocardiopsis alba]|uniref:hypothetical protein n=1 Tax=Nocardiopsis alba TaxID=53437 RepID=UPI001F47F8A8|nr:hypothetical protein [Nocardiopsis alba]